MQQKKIHRRCLRGPAFFLRSSNSYRYAGGLFNSVSPLWGNSQVKGSPKNRSGTGCPPRPEGGSNAARPGTRGQGVTSCLAVPGAYVLLPISKPKDIRVGPHPPLHPWFGNLRTPRPPPYIPGLETSEPLFGKKLHQCGAEQRASRCGVFWPCWCVGVLCAEICRLQRAVLCVDNIYRLCGSVICSVMCIDSDLNFWFFFKPLVE